MFELKITAQEDTKVKHFSNYNDFYEFVDKAVRDGFVYAVPIGGRPAVLEVVIDRFEIVIGHCYDKPTEFEIESRYDEETYRELSDDYTLYSVTDKELIKYFTNQL